MHTEKAIHKSVDSALEQMTKGLSNSFSNGLKKIQGATTSVEARMKEAADKWEEAYSSKPPSPFANSLSPGPNFGSPTPKLWSAMVASGGTLAQANTRVAARAIITTRQVKIVLEGNKGILLATMDNRTLKTKAQESITAMGQPHIIHTIDRNVKAKTLILEMASDQGAGWLLTKTLTKTWGIRYILRKFLLVVKFVSISCDLTKDRENILAENNLTNTTVHKLKWMKVLGQRRDNQQVANVLLTLMDKDAANYIWVRGLFINGVLH